MDKGCVETDAVSLALVDNLSKDGAKIKCRGPTFPSNSFGNVRSRYLREPIGSCHNLCKYGRKHESEHDEKRLTFRRFMENSCASETGQKLVKGPTAVDRKKKMVIKMKPSDTTKVLEQNIQPNKAGISDDFVETNMLIALSNHQRAISSPRCILPGNLEQHTVSLAKEIGLSDNSINIVSEAHSPTHGSMESSEKEITPRNSEQKTHSPTHRSMESSEKEITPRNLEQKTHSPIHRSMESSEEITPRNSEQKIQALVEYDEKAQLHFKEIVESDNNINVDSGTHLHESRSIDISPQVILPQLPDDEIIQAKIFKHNKNKKKVNKPKASSVRIPATSKSNMLKQKNSSASTEADSGGNTIFFEEKVLSNLNESTTSMTLKVIKQKNVVIRKQSASSKPESNNQNASFSSRKINSSATPAMPLNVRTPLMRSIPQLNTSRSMNGRMNREETSLSGNEMREVGEIKLLKSQRNFISSTIPARSTVSLKARKSGYAQHAILKNSGKAKDDSGGFKEKILKVIEPKKDGKGLEHREKLSGKLHGHASDFAVSEAGEHSNGQIQRKFKRAASKEEDKRWARRTAAVQQPADNSSSPYKLKFKRGKVIELRTADSIAPRRLRFRRGRMLEENPCGEVVKRNFRRKRGIGDSNEHNSEARAVILTKANLESKFGMLKYQDAQEKKEMRALYNHVIEETASRLVQTRKSKVKALVGAFETVILLQEAKSVV